VLIRLWVERTQPLAGTAAVEGAEPRAFDGWLDLVAVLSELVAAAAPADEGEETDADAHPGPAGR
jgi:hypothetical protein